MKVALRLAVLISLVTGLTFCGSTSTSEIPQPYRGEIQILRTANNDLTNKIQGLQKQLNEAAIEQNYNAQQMNLISGQALQSLGYSPSDYQVDVNTLKINRTKK